MFDSELFHIDDLCAFEGLYLVASGLEPLLSFQLDAIELGSTLYLQKVLNYFERADLRDND